MVRERTGHQLSLCQGCENEVANASHPSLNLGVSFRHCTSPFLCPKIHDVLMRCTLAQFLLLSIKCCPIHFVLPKHDNMLSASVSWVMMFKEK